MAEREHSIEVSVIVPVYNSEQYLRKCLDSIVGQTLRNIEIICIDDGSTDDSLSILLEYAAEDNRMIVLEQQNQYAGVARNHGMKVASGKYLMFWDSDDYYDVAALEKMYRRSEEDRADICVCGGKRFYEGSQREVVAPAYLRMDRIQGAIPFNRHSNADGILRFTETATWNKLFLRSFIEEKGISFMPLRNGNDVFFSILALCEANRITVVDEPLVCYRKGRVDSLTGTLDKAPLALLQAWEQVRDELVRRDIFPEKSFENRAVSVVKHAFLQLGSWSGCVACFEYLHSGGLDRLGLSEKPKGFYTQSAEVFLKELWNRGPEDFLLYLFKNEHMRLAEKADVLAQCRSDMKRLKQRLRKTNRTLEEKDRELRLIESSRSYKLGRALTLPLRLVRRKRM